jgi:hypothetical protein
MGGAGYNQSRGGIPTGGGFQPPAPASYGGQQSQFSAPVTGGMKSSTKPATSPAEPPTFGSVQAQARPAPTQAPAPTNPTQAPAATKPSIQGGGAQDRGAGDAFASFRGPAVQAPAPTPAAQGSAPPPTKPTVEGPAPTTPYRIPQPQGYRGGFGQQLNDMLTGHPTSNLRINSPNAPTAYGSWGAPGAVPGK